MKRNILDKGAELYNSYIKDGNDKAFEELVELYANNLIFFINRFVKDIHSCEDLMQDTFAAIIFEKKDLFLNVSFKTYLFTIAKNKALNHLKHNKKINFVPLDYYNELASKEDIEKSFITCEKWKEVNIAMKEIKDIYRLVLHLTYFEDMSSLEVAKVVNRNTKYVENCLLRGKAKLKLILNNKSFDYHD